jgi:membrane-associated phospholipid phosphatase/uncharacterized membrane protein HdeD (DUF308 family)
MARVMDGATKRIVPRREADWRVLIGKGAVLVLAGVYLLADGHRAEFTLGLVAGTALLIDGIRRVLGSRDLTGRSRDLTLVRGVVGVATGGLVVALSILQQMTVVGIRIGIGVGGLAYGLLGLALAAAAIRGRQWAALVLDVLVVVLSILLLYRVATADSIRGLLAVTAWLVIGSGIAIGLVGVMRRRRVSMTGDPTAGSVPPVLTQSESVADAADPRPFAPVLPAANEVDQRDGARRAGRRLALVSVGAAVIAGGLYIVTVGTPAGQLVGELILGGRPASPETVIGAEQVLAALSRVSLVMGTMVVVVIALVQRRPWLALAAAAAIVGANITTQLLKEIVLDRTDLLGGLFYPLPNSFPSGHATAAASVAVGLLLVVPPLLRAPSVIVSGIVVAIVGTSTLVAGWHRMADAVGGVFVATAWGAGLGAVLASRRGVEPVGRRAAALGRLSSTIPMVIGGTSLALGGLAYVLLAADPLEVLLFLAERGGSPALFVVGVLITIGASLASLGTLGFVLRDIRLDPRA